jgi:hypothetical protein
MVVRQLKLLTFVLAICALGCVAPELEDVEHVEIGTHASDWRGEVIYQLMTDRFANGDARNDYRVDPSALGHYQGGDWQGIIDRLDYLDELGVTALWISPIVLNVDADAGFHAYHGYWGVNLNRLNPHFGDLALSVYPAGEGLSQAFLRKAIREAMDRIDWSDTLPAKIRDANGLLGFEDSVRLLHNPPADVDERALVDRSHPAWEGHQAHQRQHGHALARTRLADDAQHLALVERERHAFDGVQGRALERELDVEVFDFKQWHGGQRFSLGSSASRSPSPMTLKASTAIRMARPGKVTTHQARSTNSRASASMVPHSGDGGCAPRPRKPSAAASRMAVDTPRVACTISGAAQLGSTSLNISRSVLG